jgi:hypothetical protein
MKHMLTRMMLSDMDTRQPLLLSASHNHSYPTLHAEAHDREALAAPVSDCLFFAGEACNTDLNPCVHGAMDTAQIATVSLLLALKPQPRPRL